MSCQVFLDDEIVNFEGSFPEKLSELLLFLDNFLANHHKTLKKVLVDNIPLQKEHFEAFSASFYDIKCFSQKKTNNLKNLLGNLNQELTDFYKILSLDLEKTLSTSQALLKTLELLLKALEQENYLLFILQMPIYSQLIQLFVQCLESKDIGTLMDLIEYSLKPLSQETYKQNYGE